MRGKKLGRWLGVFAVTALAAAVFAPAAGSAPAGKEPPEVPGFDGETIKLGVITPLSGLASVIGKPLTNGQVTYWDAVNDEGGIGGKYKVELVQEYSEYDVATAIQAYGKIKGDVVAFQQILGTEIVKSILTRLKADGLTGAPATLDSLWVKVPELVPIGAPYQVEAINGFDYYLRNGGEGKKICAIAQDDEYGGAGLDGLKFAAKKLKFKVAETVRFATGSDVSAQVGQLADANCEAVFLASLPNDTTAILSKMIGCSADRVLNDLPIPGHPYWSPRKNRLTNSPYCTKKGLSRPNSLLTSAMEASVGCLPANRVAGSPGGRTKKMKYVNRVMTRSTKSTQIRRRMM